MRVLVVEDQDMLAHAVATRLRRQGMAVDVVFDAEGALSHAGATAYDVVVLDRDLAELGGDEVCKTLVAAGTTSRLLMLSAASTVKDRVVGLELGADDYMAKPFDFSELVARVRALGRRAPAVVPPVLEHSDLSLDPFQRVASRSGRRLLLRPKELAVLEYLLGAQGRVVSTEELLEKVWDEMANPFTTTVTMTISRLRAKLGGPPVIETVRECGYKI
jgi:DNA-binding response OmpR family regulator